MMRTRQIPSIRARDVARALAAAFCMAAASGPACAQTPALAGPVGMEGRVVSTAGRPLVAAVVALSSATFHATAQTGVRGDFEFPDLVPGTGTIRVSEPGFRTLDCPIAMDRGHNYAVQAMLVRLGAASLPCARAVTIHPMT